MNSSHKIKPPTITSLDGLVFYLWKKNFRPYLVIQTDMVEDIWQELRCIALEVELEELDEKEQYKSIQRKIYAFLREYGYRRPKGSKGYIHNTKSLQYCADSILN